MPRSANGCDRRSFLKTTALAAAAITLDGLAPLPAQAQCGVASHFDITGTHPSVTLYEEVTLIDSTVNQSFYFDEILGRLWTLQAIHSGQPTGDLILSWNDASTGVLNTSNHYMVLYGFGHGEAFQVEHDGADTWIWMECDAVSDTPGGNAYGTKICRFKWVEAVNTHLNSSAVPSAQKYTLVPGSIHNLCAIDLSSGRLLLRYLDTTVTGNPPKLGVYLLNDIKAKGSSATMYHQWNQIAMQPDNGISGAGSMQGMTIFGDYAYFISGLAKTTCEATTAQPTYLYYQEIISSGLGNYAVNQAGYTLPRREPEGIAIWRDGDENRLAFCFSGPKRGSGCTGDMVTSFFYKNVMV